MAALQMPDPVRDHAAPGTVPRSSVVWIDEREARVARMGPEGRVSTCEITRGTDPELSFLAMVVRAIGDCERVLILGPDSIRLALERDYVAIYRRPERLVDVEPSEPIEVEALVDRLRALSG